MAKVDNQQIQPWTINWITLGFLTYVHIAGAIGIWYITALKWQTLVLVFHTFCK